MTKSIYVGFSEPERKASTMEVGKSINRISNRLRRRAKYIQAEIGIGSTQGNILDYILIESVKHPVYQKDIEAEFGMRPSTVTEMLKALERNDLIRRIPDEQDGRLKKIVFMEKAARKHETLQHAILHSEEILLEGISEEEIASFMNITQKMLENLDRAEKEDKK